MFDSHSLAVSRRPAGDYITECDNTSRSSEMLVDDNSSINIDSRIGEPRRRRTDADASEDQIGIQLGAIVKNEATLLDMGDTGLGAQLDPLPPRGEPMTDLVSHCA
jgi:hypothetical protein